MSTNHQSNSKGKYSFVVYAWFASLAALPFCFYFLLDAVGSMTSPPPWRNPVVELLLLVVGPVLALIFLVLDCKRSKITVGRVAAMLIPGLLSIIELVYAFALWSGQ
jgi:hypothetical protein